MNSQTVAVAEGAPFNQSLGFAARSAIVDNYTGSYLYLTQADRHVPPYTAGFTTPITPTDAPVVEWATPATIPVNAITGGQAKLVFTDAQLIPSSGFFVGPLGVSLLDSSELSSVGITPGNSYLVIVGAANKTITVFAWHLNVRAGGPIGVYIAVLESTNVFLRQHVATASLSVASFAGITGQVQGQELEQGIALPVGAGLQATADVANAGTVNLDGDVYFTQR